jgi:CRISPR-associated exonuclease Cas4
MISFSPAVLDPDDLGATQQVPRETIVPISALEHFSYCPRQCALIHVEGCFIDNRWTAEGTAAHRRVDAGGGPWRGGQTLRGLALFSDRLGLVGRADAVEWELGGVPYLVEYKRGHLRTWIHEAVQLCAQALCLEEMFGVAVVTGAIYYAGSKRRREITFAPALRARTEEVVAATRLLIESGEVPVYRPEPRCRRCSLQPACLPEVTGRPKAVTAYVAGLARSTDD